jgi:hypothetical protein
MAQLFCPLHVIARRNDEAIQTNTFMDCRASLAMTQSVSDTHHKNIEKKRLSRGTKVTTGPCPYFFGMYLLVFAENQQYNNTYQKAMSILFW